MRQKSAPMPTSCCRSGRRPGRICWSGRCSPSNCSAPHRSLRTTLIIVKGKAMRRAALIIAAPLLLAAGSAPVAPRAEPIDLAIARAKAEAADADRLVARLEAAAARAGDEASKLRAAQGAAAAAISAAEARISAADARATMIAALVAARRDRLARQQRPVASLLAGIATMA